MEGNKIIVKSSKSSKEKFTCVKCDYITFRKHNFVKHKLTRKHLKNARGNFGKFEETKKVVKCEFCNKIFKSKSGKWKHNKKCSENPINLKLELQKERQKNIEQNKIIASLKTENFKEKIRGLEKQLEMQKVMNTTTNITNVNKININVYLNENCKDAIPIMDFIEGLQFKLSDIDPDRPNSSVDSLRKVVIDSLNKLEDTKRPIHCSDTKRLKFYVKDASGWEKDEDHQKIDKALGYANTLQQGTWYKKAVDENLANQKNDEYYLKMNVAMGTWSDNVVKSKQKVKREISKVTKFH